MTKETVVLEFSLFVVLQKWYILCLMPVRY